MSANHNSRKNNKKRPLADDFVSHDDRNVSLPAKLDFVCAYYSLIQFFDIVEVVYLRRRNGRDELWTAWSGDLRAMNEFAAATEPRLISTTVDGTCLEFSFTTHSDKPAAALRLLEILIRGGQGLKWPTSFAMPGLVDEGAFKRLLAKIEAELKANAARAKTYENAPIVVAARELGLHPEPTGEGPIHWRANCPGTNHTIMIGAKSNEFGCGYCGKKGGPDELRAFVDERKELKARLAAQYGEVDNG